MSRSDAQTGSNRPEREGLALAVSGVSAYLSPQGAVAGLICLAILGVYISAAIWYPVAYIWLTYEDLYGEWLQTYLFLIAALLSAAIAMRRQAHYLFFSLLAVACLYVFLEEISWGQRLFGIETPELLRKHNLQQETNIHNLLTGPYDTALKRTLEYMLAVAFVAYGVIYPMLRRRIAWIARLDRDWMPAPPAYLWPYFLVAAWLEISRLSFNEAEIAEVLVGASLALLSGHYWLLSRKGLDAGKPQDWPSATSFGLLGLMLLLLASAGLAAVATTEYLYQEHQLKAVTDKRLLTGYEQFAHRYSNYGHWQAAAELYLRVHNAEPDRTPIIRRLADACRRNGDMDCAKHYSQVAFDTLLAKHAADPDDIPTHLALGRAYHQRGIVSKARSHLSRALELAKQRVAERPDSADDVYWLGRVYRGLGAAEHAARLFKHALHLSPETSKYRKAYLGSQLHADSESGDDETER